MVDDYNIRAVNLEHRTGSQEGIESNDSGYTPLFDPTGVAMVLASNNDGAYLTIDSRPIESTTTYDLTAFFDTQNGQAVILTEPKDATFMAQMGNPFDKEITIQQYDPSNPGAMFPTYTLPTDGSILSIDMGQLAAGTYNAMDPVAHFHVYVPEPASAALLLGGLLGTAALGRGKRE